MKQIKISDIILLILTITVSAAVLVAIVGIVKTGSVAATPEAVQVRMKLIDLLFMMAGIVGTAVGAILNAKYGSPSKDKTELQEEQAPVV